MAVVVDDRLLLDVLAGMPPDEVAVDPLLGEPGGRDEFVFKTATGAPLRFDNLRTNRWLHAVKAARDVDSAFPGALRFHDYAEVGITTINDTAATWKVPLSALQKLDESFDYTAVFTVDGRRRRVRSNVRRELARGSASSVVGDVAGLGDRRVG